MLKRLLCALALVVFAAAPALADPKADVANAFILFGKASSYHISAAAKGRAVEVDTEKPDKMHVVSGPMELVKIGTTTWVKAGGSWQQFNFPGLDQITSAYSGALNVVQSPQDDVTVTDLGTKTIDGTPLHAYSIVQKSGSATVYIDNGSGYPVRVVTADGSSVTFSKFNTAGPITAPQ
jgi:uncharacterized protein YaiE (UPF0345 family)